MTRIIIVAMADDHAIGKDNDLLWHLPNDMKFFRDTTMGHTVVMGRKNWESIPDKYRPLSNRTNIVLTRQSRFHIEDAVVAHRLEDALRASEANNDEKCFIIGGGEIYKLALEEDLVDEMYITRVAASFPDADTHFPTFDSSQWDSVEIQQQQTDDRHPYGFRVMHYVKKV